MPAKKTTTPNTKPAIEKKPLDLPSQVVQVVRATPGLGRAAIATAINFEGTAAKLTQLLGQLVLENKLRRQGERRLTVYFVA